MILHKIKERESLRSHCTWSSMEGGSTGSDIMWVLVFLPFSVWTDGLLAVVISQKLLFLVVGTGDRKRWLGLFKSPGFDDSFGRKLALVTTFFTHTSDGFSFLFESSRIISSFCFNCEAWSFFILAISSSSAFTVILSSLTGSSAPFFLDSGVKQFPVKKEGLGFLFSFGWAVDGGVTRDVTEEGVGETFAAKDCAWRVSNFCCWRINCTRNSRFSFCSSSRSLAWSVPVSGTSSTSSFASHAWKYKEYKYCNKIQTTDFWGVKKQCLSETE